MGEDMLLAGMWVCDQLGLCNLLGFYINEYMFSSCQLGLRGDISLIWRLGTMSVGTSLEWGLVFGGLY